MTCLHLCTFLYLAQVSVAVLLDNFVEASSEIRAQVGSTWFLTCLEINFIECLDGLKRLPCAQRALQNFKSFFFNIIERFGWLLTYLIYIVQEMIANYLERKRTNLVRRYLEILYLYWDVSKSEADELSVFTALYNAWSGLMIQINP